MPGPTTEVLNDDIKEMRGEMHRLEVAMLAGFQRLEGLIVGEVRRLDTSLTRVESSFTDQLRKTENRLDEKIHRVEVQLTEKIGQVETQLTEKIGQVETQLGNRIGQVETQLGNRIGQVEVSLAKTEYKLLERSIESDKLVAGVQGEFRIVKLILSATLATAVGGVISFSFWAGTLSARIGSMEDRANKVDTRLERVEGNTVRPGNLPAGPVQSAPEKR